VLSESLKSHGFDNGTQNPGYRDKIDRANHASHDTYTEHTVRILNSRNIAKAVTDEFIGKRTYHCRSCFSF
jgi:hypothetical protein